MNEIKVGIIGFGFMGKTHTYGYRTIPLHYGNLPFKIKLAGVCDASYEIAQQAKESLDFEFATSNPDDIFSRKDISVINVCTPNIYHKDMVLRAIATGKNVYCDKPLTACYEESEEIMRALEQSSVTTQMALQYRFFPATMRAKELIEEGKIGNIMSFRSAYLHSGSVDPNKPFGWKQDKKFGGGVLYDLGAHVFDLIYYLLGEYADLFAETSIVYPRRPDKNGNLQDIEADDLAIIIARMKTGGTGVIEASKIATGANDELRFEIHGDRGAMRFNLMEPNWLDFYDNTIPDAAMGGFKGFTRIECVQRFKKPGGDFPGSKFSIGWIRSHIHSLYNFLDCVHTGKPASPSFKEGAYIQYVMEQAYASNQSKTWMHLK